MKATELRINNYVNHPRLGSGYVEWIILKGGDYHIHIRLFEPILEEQDVQTWSIEAEINDFLFIPLTEQWLKDFGFKKANHIAQDGYYIPNTDIIFTGRITKLRQNLGLIGYDRNIHYVHQLQNLYFALTGKELILQKSKEND